MRASTRAPFTRPGIGHLWSFVAQHLSTATNGGWHAELSEDLRPPTLFLGKPDLYHALQACLIPLYPAEGSLTRVIQG